MESGNGDAVFYLTKAKMAMIAAHSAKRVRQADRHETVCRDVVTAGGTEHDCLVFGSAHLVAVYFSVLSFLMLQHPKRATRTET